MSLATVIGLDARVLLTTDDPATHEVYDRLIEMTRRKFVDTRSQEARNAAAYVVQGIANTFFKRKAG